MPEEFVQPELRDGPPWAMEEMIAAEATLPSEIAAEPGVAVLGGRLRDAVASGGPILFTGLGTSQHAARAAAATVASVAPDVAVSSDDGFEVGLEPPGRGLVVGVSHDGGTRSTLDAVTGAAAAGAAVVLITHRPDRAPEGIEAIATPRQDRSWCHTVGYVSPLLAVALALEAIAPERAEALVRAELDARPQRREDAERIGDCERLLMVGSGVDEITASELALKVEEAAFVPSTPLGAEKVLHGHLPAADASTGVVLLRFDDSFADRRNERAANVAAATAVLEMPLVTVRAASPVAGAAEALLAGAVALQLLTLELAHVRGTNPDLIRREQEPYRRVAEAAGLG